MVVRFYGFTPGGKTTGERSVTFFYVHVTFYITLSLLAAGASWLTLATPQQKVGAAAS